MSANLPTDNADAEKNERDSGRRDGGRFISIKDFHYHANDIAELRKLAEIDPALANKIVEQRDREHARETASYKFGVICALALLAMILAAFTALLIYTGLFATLAAIAGILAVALLIRVILTGEWSDTTWLGKFLGVIIKALGGNPSSDDERH